MKSVFYLFFILLLNKPAIAQTNVDEQVKAIRKEYQKINANLNNYTFKEVQYIDEQNYWMNVRYKAYLNSNEDLVLLMFSIGEEGYWADYELYFKDKKIFFVYTVSGDPDGNERQDRVYLYNSRIIKALVKSKPGTSEMALDQFENKTNDEIMRDLDQSTNNYIRMVDSNLEQFWQAVEKNK